MTWRRILALFVLAAWFQIHTPAQPPSIAPVGPAPIGSRSDGGGRGTLYSQGYEWANARQEAELVVALYAPIDWNCEPCEAQQREIARGFEWPASAYYVAPTPGTAQWQALCDALKVDAWPVTAVYVRRNGVWLDSNPTIIRGYTEQGWSGAVNTALAKGR